MLRHMHVHGISIASIILLAAICLPTFIFPSAVSADWGPDVQISNSLSWADGATVAVSGNYVHTAWQQDLSGTPAIYYRRSADGGATWGAITCLVSDPSGSVRPRIGASGSYVYVAWVDGRDGESEVYFKRSADNGATWGPDTRLSDLPYNSSSIDISVSGSNINVVWIDRRHTNREVYYKGSTDYGATWGADTLISVSMPGFSQEPAVAASGNSVYVAWEYVTIGGNYDLYFTRSTNNGVTWDSIQQLTTDPNTQWYVSIAASGNIIHLAWDDDRDGNREIYYKRSADGGTTWGADTRLTSDPSEDHQVFITSSGSNAFVTWVSDRSGSSLVYYRQSADGGLTWGAETLLSDAAVDVEYPSAFLSGNTVHAVWTDGRTIYHEIYYKKSSAVITTPTIISFTPTSGGNRTTVIITGTNFTGATAVLFGGKAATGFTVNSATQITAITGTGSTGRITVRTPAGDAVSATNFNFESAVSTTPHGSSVSGVTGTVPQGPVSLPTVSVRSASLSATKVAPGTPITVTADVVNTGTVNGSSSIKVYVNGELENSQGVTVNSGSSTPVTFTVSRNEPGTYSVYVGGTNAGSFTVDQFTPETILIISGALVLFALIMGIIYTIRRKTS